jgi:pimeloyl-ACP methyl ester carboxylesterase
VTNAEVSDDDLAGLDEFGLLHENAEQIGVGGPLPSVQRIESGSISALKWGDERPQVVFLHGGGQNAHTWDTVIVGLGLPALAIDLPGHGRSAWREDGDYGPRLNAEALRPVLREWAPNPRLVVGMSLGGLTALRIAASEPELVPELMLVDVTPSAPERHEQMTKAQMGTVALVQGDRTFPSFEAMLEVTVAAAPNRDRKSLRRGVFHNSKQNDDGTWTWRYDSFRKATASPGCGTTCPPSRCRPRSCAARTRTSSTTRTPRRSPTQRRASSAHTSSPIPGIRFRATSRPCSSRSCGGCWALSVPSCSPIASQLIAKLS